MKDIKKQLILDIKIVILIITCILINYYGKQIALNLSLPLWLDSVGTVIAAYIMGPLCGAIIGVSVNIMYAMQSNTDIFYFVTSIVIGVTAGICGRKKMFENSFKVSCVASLMTLLTTLTSTPINCITNHGYTGNIWGDGFFEMLNEWNVFWVFSSIIAQIMLEFGDKILTLFILFFIIKIHRKYREIKEKRGYKKLLNTVTSVIVIIVIASQAILSSSVTGFAKEPDSYNDYNEYIQTVYSNNNGLLSGEANDIVTTNDGILWIATYAGLYRYNGTSFTYINQFDNVKNANDLYVDDEGRLWIGTNDNGVSILINGEVTNTIDDKNGLPTNSVRSIVQQSSGNYFIGTSDKLAIVSLSGGIKVVGTLPEIIYAKSLAADKNDHVVAVDSNGDAFLIEGSDIKHKYESSPNKAYFTSACFDSEGYLYLGDEDGYVYKYVVENDDIKLVSEYFLHEKTVVNSIYETQPGEIFVCAENDISCIRNEEILCISVGSFNSSIERMTVDYQGNLWFSSSRLGVMKMCKTAFSELYQEYNLPETVVNTITKWNNDFYFGSDSGLDIVSENLLARSGNRFTEELKEKLKDTRIRCLTVDSLNRLWICTYNRGILCVNTDGDIIVYDENDGIEGNKFRHALELSDGTMAVSHNQGVTFIKNDKVEYSIGSKDGLTNSVVLCLYEMSDGTILAGTDGGGIFKIKDKKVTGSITKTDGLGSEVILRMTKDKDNEGTFVVTSNGVAYINEEGNVKNLNNFPYSNNYDVYDLGDGRLMVPSSAGIYIVNKHNLLSGNSLSYELLNYMSGLRGTLTANAWNYVDNNEVFYYANGSGVTQLKLKNYDWSTSSYRMLLSSIKIDGQSYWVDRNEIINIPREAEEIELHPEIINYSTNDPYVRIYMQGVTEGPLVYRQSELPSFTYNKLAAGTYKFNISILDEDKIIEEQTYTLVKEKRIHDNYWFKLYFFLELVAIIAWITWFFTRITLGHAIEMQKKQIEFAKQQIHMGNETILAIAKTVDAKDENTSQHSVRVSEYSLLIAKKLGYSEEDCENLRKAALLHDIGKIGIPDSVLNKPGRLNDEEYAIMKSHVIKGGEILKDFTLIPNVQVGAMYHHERYDGKGYVHGLKGEEIPEWARIIGIADAFDAMTANRVYRKQLDFDFVLNELKKGRGTQFDPNMTDIFLQLIEEGEIDIEALYVKKDLNT